MLFTQIVRAVGLTLMMAPASAMAAGAEGLWQTIDDNTHKPRSHVRIEAQDGVIKGTIAHLVSPSSPNPKCSKCDGAKKDKPIQGLEIMWGLKAKADKDKPTWEEGKILDPESGKTYDCKIWLEDENTLKVRGSILFFGRTQTWHRIDEKGERL